MTSVIPTCSNDSAAVEVVARSWDDIQSEDGQHANLFIRIDYICVGNDSQQVRDNLQIWVVVGGIYSRCCLGMHIANAHPLLLLKFLHRVKKKCLESPH